MGNSTKPYYADYVNHCLRFYASYPDKCPNQAPVDKRNWDTVDQVMKEQTEQMREIIIYAYATSKNDVRTNVQYMSKITNVPVLEIWKNIFDISHRIAEVRELI